MPLLIIQIDPGKICITLIVNVLQTIFDPGDPGDTLILDQNVR